MLKLAKMRSRSPIEGTPVRRSDVLVDAVDTFVHRFRSMVAVGFDGHRWTRKAISILSSAGAIMDGMKQRVWFVEYKAIKPGHLRWTVRDCERNAPVDDTQEYVDDEAALAAALRKLGNDGERITQISRRDGSIWLLIN